MSLKSFLAKFVSLVSLFFWGACPAWTHAVVLPQRVEPNAFEKFVLRVPTEKPMPTTVVRLLIPDKVQILGLAAKPGWSYATEKDDGGRVKSITWSGGEVLPGEFIEFEFMGRTAKERGKAVWKAFQTYKDGSVVAWTGPPEAKEPASVTLVEPAAESTPGWAGWSALAISIAAGLAAVFAIFKRS